MAGPYSERQELEDLRKLKRLEELEAKAAGRSVSAPPQAAPTAPASPFLQRGMNMVAGAQATAPRPVSRMEAAALGAQRGGSFATADEAEGVRNALNMIPQAPGPIGSMTNFAMGLGGMAMEAMTDKLPQSYTQGRDVLRAKEEAARTQHPVTFGGSEIAGSVLIPVGGTARAATKGAQIAKGAAAGAGTGAVYGFAAEDGTLEERAKAGAIGGTVGGAFGGLLSAVIPRDIPLSDVLNAELFGTKVSRPVLKTIERMLVDAGVPANRVEAGVINIRQRLQSGQGGTGLPTRFKDELVKEFGEGARGVSKAIETQIRGGAARSGSASDTAVARAVNEDNAAARELFNRSVDQFAGSTSRPELRGQAIGQLENIVEQRYKPILARPIADPTKQQALIDVLNLPRMKTLASELAEDAEREGIDLAALIARNPADAAHWMQSKARQLADDRGTVTITGAVKPDRIMSNRRKDILDALEDAVPGYRETRMEYGDKYGVTKAINFAKGFLTRAKDDVAVADMAEEFADLSEAQKQMALASLRSVVTGSAENVRYVDPELGASALRTAEIGKEPVLKALSEVFGEQGTKLADDIKAIVSRTDANRRINPQATGSDTVPKAEAIKFAMRNTRGPVQRFVGNMLGGAPLDILGSAFTGGPTPISAARAGIEGAGKVADTRAMSTVDRVTELLLSQPQTTRALNALPPSGAPPTGGGQIIEQLTPTPGTPPAGAPSPQAPPQAPRTVGVAPAMAAPVMPPPTPAPSPAPAPARSGPPPFPPPLETMEWTGPIPREPAGLLAFIRKLGGIKEEFGRFREQGYMSGSVAQMLGDVRSRPGLLNNQTGQTIDELARSARDAGFDIRDDEDFMRQLANELQGRGKTYRIGEAEEWNIYQEFLRDKARAENSERIYDEIPFGFGRTDTTNALAGGTLGGIAPAESDEERLRNIAIGTGLGAGARRGSQMLDDATRTVGRPRVPGGMAPGSMAPGSAAPSGRTVGQGGYFGRQSLRPPGSGPSAREIETQQQWSTATPIVSQARTTAQSAQQAADAALQSKAPADIARAKDAKKTLVGQLQEAQASRAGMDTPEDARLAETLASLTENTSDPVLLSTQISAAKTSLDRLLTDIGSPVEGNLIPVKTNILTRTQAPRSAAEPAPERPSVTRYAEGTDEIKPQGFGAGENPTSDSIRQKIVGAYAETEGLSNRDRGSRLKQAVEDYRSFVRTASADELRATSDLHFDRDLLFKLEAPQLAKMMKTLGLPAPSPTMALSEMRDAIKQAINPTATSPLKFMGFGASTPKTPQQAARFETPGSPEYEAAVAKGLDMSQAGRMARAREMGFDTDIVLYHGTTGDISSFKRSKTGSVGPGIYLTDDAEDAAAFARPDRRPGEAVEGTNIMPLYIKRSDVLPMAPLSKDHAARLSKYLGRQINEGDPVPLIGLEKKGGSLAEGAEAAGFAGLEHPGRKGAKHYVIFDPSNIRSVNAAFDPDKATSSTLLAAAPFAAVGGAGLTLAGEDARNQRTVGKPKAVQSGTSQSARTVGKAKTN